jgi:hypothetical protein
MEFRAIKITVPMGKIGLAAEHSKPVQSRKKYTKTTKNPIKMLPQFKQLEFLINKEVLQ